MHLLLLSVGTLGDCQYNIVCIVAVYIHSLSIIIIVNVHNNCYCTMLKGALILVVSIEVLFLSKFSTF